MKKTLTAMIALFHVLSSHSLYGIVKPKSTPLLRIEGDLHHLHPAPNDRYMAFMDRHGKDLRLLDLKSGEVFEITKNHVGVSLFWAPDGFRLFYREIYQTAQGVESRLMVYDLKLRRQVELEKFAGTSGFLSFDPRDLRFFLMKENGIMSRAIVYPDERLARWQRARRKQQGRWVVAPKRVLWLTHGGLTMRDLPDDQSGIQSFDISPDGSTIVWTTQSGQLLISKEGGEPRQVAQGSDPRWHPKKPLIVYASPQKLGHRTIHTNLKVTDMDGRTRKLTKTVNRNERWPVWSHDGRQIYYTVEDSTDLFIMDFEP